MADPQELATEVYLQYRSTAIISEIKAASLVISSEVISILYKNNHLLFLNLRSSETASKELENIHSFRWFSDNQDASKTCFAVVTTDNCLSLYELFHNSRDSIKNSTINLLYQYNIYQLQQLLSDQGKDIQNYEFLELVGIYRNIIVLLLDSFYLVTLEFHQTDRPTCLVTNNLKNMLTRFETRTFIQCSLVENYLACLHNDRKIYIFSIEDGHLLSFIDTLQYLSFVNVSQRDFNIVQFVLLNSLKWLIVIGQANEIYKINLVHYFEIFPKNRYFPDENPTLQFPSVHRNDEDSFAALYPESNISVVATDKFWKHQIGELHKKWCHKRIKKSGFDLGVIRFSESHSSGFSSLGEFSPKSDLQEVVLQLPIEKMSIESVCSSDCSAFIWLQDKESVIHGTSSGAVCFIDLSSGTSRVFQFEGEVFVLFPTYSDHIPILLRGNSISALTWNINRETLINKLMTYENTSVADLLARLNQWESISIPVQSLKIGLKHRQLDTVAFFLKGQEKDVHKRKSRTLTGSFMTGSISESELDGNPSSSIIELLIESIEENYSDRHSKNFAEQLLHLTLDYLNRQIMIATDVSSQICDDSKDSCNQLEIDDQIKKTLEYIFKLRTYLNRENKTQSLRLQHQTKKSEEKSMVKRWKHLSVEEIIEDALLHSCIPLAQSFILEQEHLEEKSQCNIETVINIGLKLVMTNLYEENIDKATELILNMGFEVKDILRSVFFFTADKHIRDVLANELQKMFLLSQEEVKMVEFVHLLERFFTCSSFQQAKNLRGDETSKSVVWESAVILETGQPNIELKCGEVVPCEEINCESSNYLQLLLEWTRCWDQLTRDKIMIERLLYFNDPQLNDLMNPEALWDFLCAHNDWSSMRQWIQTSFSDEGNFDSSFFYKHPITGPLLDSFKHCTQYFKDQVLDYLARIRIFSSIEINDFNLLLRRLGRFYLIHSSNTSPDDNILTIAPKEFPQQLLKFCIKKQLINVLYFFTDYYRIADNQGQSLFDNQPSMNMILSFQKLAKEGDTNAMFEAGLANSRMLWAKDHVTITDMLHRGEIILALATLAYAPGTFQQALEPPQTDEEKIWKVSPELLKEKLQIYPKLLECLFPTCTPGGLPPQDITVYHLLQGTAPFDPTGLFGWQSTNTIKSSDVMEKMPYFSHPDLMRQYGHSETLNFTYYLHQGRSTFAVVSFLAKEIDLGGTLTNKRIARGCRQAHFLALRNLSQIHIGASCVSFAEMLGQDTLEMRTNLQTASVILSYLNSKVINPLEKKMEAEKENEESLSKMFISLLNKHKKIASEIKLLLEEAISDSIEKNELDKTSFETGKKWHLALLFCSIHELEMSSVHLLDCAQSDNWPSFVIFAQMHQYPREQVLQLVKEFSSSHLQEHLQHAFEHINVSHHATKKKETKSKIQERDSRAMLYSKIGFSKDKESTSENDDESSTSSDFSAIIKEASEDTKKEDVDIKKEDVPNNLFDVLLKCHSVQLPVTPWRQLLSYSIAVSNPVLAILAICYEDASVLSCLCTWLLTSLNESAASLVTAQITGSLQHHQWTLFNLTSLIYIFLKTDNLNILTQGFELFQKDSPLLPFFQFLKVFVNKKKWLECNKHLEQYIENITQLQKTSKVSLSSNSSFLGSCQWFEETCINCVKQLLNQLSSYEGFRMIEIFHLTQFSEAFTMPVPDFSKVFKIQMILRDAGLFLKSDNLLQADLGFCKETCEKVLKDLQQKYQYETALKFASAISLPLDNILINEVSYNLTNMKTSRLWNKEESRFSFWNKCDEIFTEHRLNPEMAFTFFKDKVDDALSQSEKAEILQLACKWLKLDTSSNHDEEFENLQIDMWICRIKIEVEKHQVSEANEELLSNSYSFLSKKNLQNQREQRINKLQLIKTVSDFPMPSGKSRHKLENPLELQALEKMIGNLLDRGNISEACHLEALFNHKSPNLNLVLACLYLAEGAILPHELDEDIKRMIGKEPMKTKKRLNIRVNQTSSNIQAASQISLLDYSEPYSDSTEVTRTMDQLQEYCEQGHQCCDRISTYYKIVLMLNRSYESVVTENEFIILKDVLKCDKPQKLSLAKSYITTSGLQDKEVAKFLAENIQYSLKVWTTKIPEDTGAPKSSSELIFNPSDGTETFNQLIKLCDDPSLLGNKLLEAASLNTGEYSVEVELLVQAHNCYTVSCNMEGIANVLRAARTCVATLAQAGEFPLMVRLLIGVGRFNEMTYIFDVLRKHHQLEILFRKGIEKANKLKIALLDYLKRFHPTDTDTYTMISLHFTMFREIGEMQQQMALKELYTLKHKPIEDTPEIRSKLMMIIELLTDAEKNFSTEACLRHAQMCQKQIRLVALQQHLLPLSIRVVCLDLPDVIKFVTSHNKFYEAYLVVDAYNTQVDWSLVLFNAVIFNGDFKYLQDFQAHLTLSSNLMTEVALRYKFDSNKTSQVVLNMKKLLTFLSDIRIQHKLACELGFNDVVADLLNGDGGAYLQDTLQ